MKRYCLLKCDTQEFADGKLDIWNINYEMVVSHCRKQKLDQDAKQANFNDFDFYIGLDQIIESKFCELDIYNELYLILQSATEEKENLFLEDWSSVNDVIGVTQTIKNNIKNLNRKGNDNRIFSQEKFSTDKGNKIDSLGSNVMRLWLFSKEFRNLFIRTETRFEKYENKEIEQIFKKCDNLKLNYRADDYIILEKLLGLNTDTYFRNYILGYLDEPYFELLEPLLEVLMKWRGCFSRCLIIRYIGIRLHLEKQCGYVNEKKRIIEYTEIMNKKLEDYNTLYDLIIKEILDGLKKLYSCNESKKLVEMHRNNLIEDIKVISAANHCKRFIENTFMSTYQQAIEQDKSDKEFAEKIKHLQCTEQIVQELRDHRQKIIFPEPGFFYFLDSIVTQKSCMGCEDDLTRKIQSVIVNSSYDTYNIES